MDSRVPSTGEMYFYRDFLEAYNTLYDDQIAPVNIEYDWTGTSYSYTMILNQGIRWNRDQGWFDDDGNKYTNFKAVIDHLGL